MQTTTFDKCKKSFLRGPNDWETRHRNREFTDQVQLSHIAKRLMIITRNPKPSFIFSFRIVVSKSPIVIQSVFHPSFMVKVAVFGSRFFFIFQTSPQNRQGPPVNNQIRTQESIPSSPHRRGRFDTCHPGVSNIDKWENGAWYSPDLINSSSSIGIIFSV